MELNAPSGGDQQFDVLVIGAGQAGLAIGYHLAQHQIDLGDRRKGGWSRRMSRVDVGLAASAAKVLGVDADICRDIPNDERQRLA